MHIQLPEKFSSYLLLVAALCISLVTGCVPNGESGDQAAEPEKYRVGVFVLASHPVIFDLRDGFLSQLKSLAETEGFELDIDEKNAEGQSAQLNQLSAYFTRGRHDLVYTVGSAATLNIKARSPNVPILFAGVPDPVRNGFVEELDKPGYGMTGARFLPPADVIFRAFMEAYPDSKSVAVLRNPSEINSASTAEPFMEYFEKKGIQVKDFPVTEMTQLNAVLQQLRGADVDAVFVPTDNLIYQNLKRVVEACDGMGIPLMSVTDTSVEMGASFAVGVPYYRVGEITGEMAADILMNDKKANEVPVQEINRGFLYVNSKALALFSSWESPDFPLKVVE